MDERTQRQHLGVQKWVESKCAFTLCYATGVGKSYTGILAIKKFLAKNPQGTTCIIVPTENLKIQWIKNLSKEGLLLNIEVKIINSAVLHDFKVDLLIVDEIHAILAPTFFKLLQVCKYSMILGLTATFERLDGKHELLNKYCPICDTITVKEATEKGWLSPYKEYKIMLDVDLTDYQIANTAFMEHFAFFDYQFDTAMACMAGITRGGKIIKPSRQCIREYAKFIQPDPKFEKQIIAETSAHAFGWGRALKARKDFVMNHPKKIEIAQLILENRPNSKAITFNSTIKQCEKFKIGSVVHSGNTKKKNRLTMEEFNDLEVGVIHSSKSLTEGVDIKGLNLAIILHNTSSPRERIQKIKKYLQISFNLKF